MSNEEITIIVEKLDRLEAGQVVNREDIKESRELFYKAMLDIKNAHYENLEKLGNKIDDYISSDTVWKDKDAEWKKEAQPVIDMGKNLQGFSKVSLYFLGFVAAISGAIWGVITIFKK